MAAFENSRLFRPVRDARSLKGVLVPVLLVVAVALLAMSRIESAALAPPKKAVSCALALGTPVGPSISMIALAGMVSTGAVVSGASVTLTVRVTGVAALPAASLTL